MTVLVLNILTQFAKVNVDRNYLNPHVFLNVSKVEALVIVNYLSIPDNSQTSLFPLISDPISSE